MSVPEFLAEFLPEFVARLKTAAAEKMASRFIRYIFYRASAR